MAFITLVISAQRSNGFFKLIKKFHLFDTFSLQKKCPSNFNIQILYMLYASSIEVYYFMSSVFNFFGNPIIVLIWTLMTMTTMIMIIQYISFIRILRDRYKIANEIFLRSKYLLKIVFLIHKYLTKLLFKVLVFIFYLCAYFINILKNIIFSKYEF